tara:strand:- start:50 stop:1195 length:1146 start_codon:yes stop_codon:yes gene_type:complete
MLKIPFNKPYVTDNEFKYLKEAYEKRQLAGDGYFTNKCHLWLEQRTGCHKALLTHSCTAALEMAALLLDIKEGDEVIMPSYTFVSTANAFALRGGVPIFVEIRKDNLNINEEMIESAITEKTKAIVPVHYAGNSCEIERIIDIAKRYNLFVVEDAAQGVMSEYKGKALGTFGDIGCLSFHETKNIISGEGGAILINNKKFVKRAEYIREKGTNRSQFSRGEISKYTWIDIGSSYLPGELVAAFLWAQMQSSNSITNKRIKIWNQYHKILEKFEEKNLLIRPTISPDCKHNAHMYYIILNNENIRNKFIKYMNELQIGCVFHYIPLHSSPFYKKNYKNQNLPITSNLASRIVRLPLWPGLEKDLEFVIESFIKFFNNIDQKF